MHVIFDMIYERHFLDLFFVNIKSQRETCTKLVFNKTTEIDVADSIQLGFSLNRCWTTN